MNDRVITPAELAPLAKEARRATGKSQIEAARELGVRGATMCQAEEQPEKSLNKLRKKIIEEYSDYEVVGPVYILRHRGSRGDGFKSLASTS